MRRFSRACITSIHILMEYVVFAWLVEAEDLPVMKIMMGPVLGWLRLPGWERHGIRHHTLRNIP